MPKRPVVPNAGYAKNAENVEHAENSASVASGAEQLLPPPESTPPIPDLSGVDLRTLRRTPLDARPELAAAVAHRLRNPRGEQGGWHSGGTDNPKPPPDKKYDEDPATALGADRPPGRRGVRRRRPGR